MPGSRRFNDPAETTRKLTLLVPIEIDQQLRRLAAYYARVNGGGSVGGIVRSWIEQELARPENVARITRSGD